MPSAERHDVIDPRRPKAWARATSGRSRSGHGLLLVLGGAGLFLGAVLVHDVSLPTAPEAEVVLHLDAAPMAAADAGGAPEQRLETVTTLPESPPPTPASRAATSGATGLLGPCPPYFDLGHDLGQDLAAMTQQAHRITRACPAKPPGAPAQYGVPASVRILAEGQ